uniref:Uncharacterized protein n=1 Tax=Anopheles merus TaxID=30066 RepID=A0A182V3T4_ANOME
MQFTCATVDVKWTLEVINTKEQASSRIVRGRVQPIAPYQINEKRFFFGTWLTLIFRNFSGATPLRGLNRFTCSPTLIFFVSAPCGKTACTCGTTVLDTMPPSGPIACTSWRMREITAKYCGKSYVTKRQMRPPPSSSSWASSHSFSTSWMISSDMSMLCSRQVSPLSERRITISRSLPRSEAKWGTSMMTGPKNLAPTGPSSSTRLASASPSISGGGCMRHVMRVGCAADRAGTMMRTPLWRQPRMAPPRASTRKETKKLAEQKANRAHY